MKVDKLFEKTVMEMEVEVVVAMEMDVDVDGAVVEEMGGGVDLLVNGGVGPSQRRADRQSRCTAKKTR